MSLHIGNPRPIPGYLLDKLTTIIKVSFSSVKVLWNLFGFETSVIFSVVSRLPYYIILIVLVSIQFISSWYFKSYVTFRKKTRYSQWPLNKTSRPSKLQQLRAYHEPGNASSCHSALLLKRLVQWHNQTSSAGIIILCLRIGIISLF